MMMMMMTEKYYCIMTLNNGCDFDVGHGLIITIFRKSVAITLGSMAPQSMARGWSTKFTYNICNYENCISNYVNTFKYFYI